MNANYMVKVEDAKLPDIQKALKGAGIKVRSIVQIFKEGKEASEEQEDAG